MLNLVIGLSSLVMGALLFVLSDTVFGNSSGASYSMFLGAILFFMGVLMTVIGLIQVLIGAVRKLSEKE